MKITVYILNGKKLIKIYSAIVFTEEEKQTVVDNISENQYYTED
jgi:hypothetical protein